MPIVLKSGSLNFLEPSRPIKACNGIAFIGVQHVLNKYTGRIIKFSVNTNTNNKKTEGPASLELFIAKGKLKKFFLTTRDVGCVHHG
jgi:hypothetical protein